MPLLIYLVECEIKLSNCCKNKLNEPDILTISWYPHLIAKECSESSLSVTSKKAETTSLHSMLHCMCTETCPLFLHCFWTVYFWICTFIWFQWLCYNNLPLNWSEVCMFYLNHLDYSNVFVTCILGINDNMQLKATYSWAYIEYYVFLNNYVFCITVQITRYCEEYNLLGYIFFN